MHLLLVDKEHMIVGAEEAALVAMETVGDVADAQHAAADALGLDGGGIDATTELELGHQLRGHGEIGGAVVVAVVVAGAVVVIGVRRRMLVVRIVVGSIAAATGAGVGRVGSGVGGVARTLANVGSHRQIAIVVIRLRGILGTTVPQEHAVAVVIQQVAAPLWRSLVGSRRGIGRNKRRCRGRRGGACTHL